MLVRLLQALSLKLVVLLEDALTAPSEVIHVFTEITVVFENFVKPQQAVDFVLLP